MANLTSLSVYKYSQAGSAINVAFPTAGSFSIILETAPANTIIAGVTILTLIILPSSGLNKKERIYYSASSVATIVTALGAGYIAISVYKSEQSSAAISVAFPVTELGATVVEQYVGTLTIAGATIASQLVVPGRGLNQAARVYYSASTVAQIVTAFG